MDPGARCTVWFQSWSGFAMTVSMAGDTSDFAPRIIVVAPRGMHFGPAMATSIDLCIHDFVRFSRFRRTSTVVANAVAEPFKDVDVKLVDGGGTPRGRLRELAGVIAQERPDLVIVHQHLATAAGLAKSGLGCPVVLHAHNFQKPARNPVSAYLRTRRYRALDAIVFVSDAVADAFRATWKHIAVPVYTAHNGIDAVPWEADPAQKEKLILFVGRAAPEKGVLETARALRSVLADQRQWRAEVILSETDVHPDYLRSVLGEIDACNGQIRVRRSLPHEDVRLANARATIAIVPSIYAEPFGRTAIEAMAAGAALVVSRRGGLPEIAGDAALYLDEVTAGTIAAATARLIGDPGLRDVLAERAKVRCRTIFDVRLASARLDAIYCAVLGLPSVPELQPAVATRRKVLDPVNAHDPAGYG